jgi:hypothetical protein
MKNGENEEDDRENQQLKLKLLACGRVQVPVLEVSPTRASNYFFVGLIVGVGDGELIGMGLSILILFSPEITSGGLSVLFPFNLISADTPSVEMPKRETTNMALNKIFMIAPYSLYCRALKNLSQCVARTQSWHCI